ncbi:tetratricopeptide repeat protein [Iodidimonas muriae]|nr:tetratricopeptide repeat protein [Iodidimonas muriae]
MKSILFMAQMGALCTLGLIGTTSGASAQQNDPLSELPIDQRRANPAGLADSQPNTEAAPTGDGDTLAPLMLPPTRGISSAKAQEEANRYRACMQRLGTAPDRALENALAWLADGPSLPAEHCAAAALVALGRPDAAAQRYSRLADDMRTGRGLTYDIVDADDPYSLLAGIYAQMGNALLLADKPEQAYTAFSNGLAQAPLENDPLTLDLHVDRARTLGLMGEYEDAIKDLEKARLIGGWRADIALYLASAYRALGDLEPALDAAIRAVELDQQSPAARLERANIHMLTGDEKAARTDWQTIVTRWPDAAAALAARANLAALDQMDPDPNNTAPTP